MANAGSIADRTALLSYGVISTAMMSLVKALNLFGLEKPIVQREVPSERVNNKLALPPPRFHFSPLR